jgi:uncharacterized damage-inducible protein DinB
MSGMPTLVEDEKGQLLAYLEQQRHFIRLAAYGLTDEEARLSPSVSSLSVGGLIKHVAKVEEHWMGIVLERPAEPSSENYEDGFRLGPDETLEGALAFYDSVARATERVVDRCPLDQRVPVPQGVPWFPKDIDAWNVRWVVLHLIEETARHAGHADIVRESIDGATWFTLMSAADNVDLRPWVEPWKPARKPAEAVAGGGRRSPGARS